MKHILIFTIIVSIWSCDSKKSERYNQGKTKMVFDTTGYSLKVIENLHERLTLKDYDNSLLDYINSNPNKIDSIRRVVYLLPFGNMKPEIKKIIISEVEYLTCFLQLEVKVLDIVSYDSIKKLTSIKTRMVPSSDFNHFSKMKGEITSLREQIQANTFMEYVIMKNKPKDAVAVLGITEHDIYNPKFNYLFGISRMKDGVGIISTFRLIDYGYQTRNNIRKVISKQILNIFSIPNVRDFKCVLNYHPNYSELLKGKFYLSPKALEKLKYAIGFNYQKRFEDLSMFWKKEQNIEEEEYYTNCVKLTKNKNQNINH